MTEGDSNDEYYDLPGARKKPMIQLGPKQADTSTDSTGHRIKHAPRLCVLSRLLLLGAFFLILRGRGIQKFLWLSTDAFRGTGSKTSATTSFGPSTPFGGANDFNWTAHLPTKWLNWTDCYEILDLRFQCTRLSVPLDYSEPDGEQAAVALVRHQSPYPPGHDKYKGPILFNPGGPGGSGVVTVLGAARVFRKLLGDEFDFIGFDPRGVLFTTPHFNVFESTIESAKFYLEMPSNLNASSTSFSETFVRSKILGKLADERAKYASYLSTATVATDMMNIVNATGYDKLQYWGFSYGTVLGATFAAMFPDKVGRIVIDGVVDSEDYYAGLWSNNLRDTDAALTDIYEACVKAGPGGCSLYEEDAELIAQRVNKLLEKIKSEPVPYYTVGGPLGYSYGLIDYSLVKGLIFSTLYNTHGGGGKRLLSILASLERGETETPWEGMTPTFAIACGDAAPIEETLEEARTLYDKMAQSTTFSDTWPIHIYCAGWPIRAKDRFKGSFERNTSYPLLLIGNTADPVTPLWNAHKMSRGFTDSVVLTQNSSGHCSVSAASVCTFKAVRNYFLKGTLPERGTVCQTESSIFADTPEMSVSLSSEDRELLQAAEELRRMHIVSTLFEPQSMKYGVEFRMSRGEGEI